MENGGGNGGGGVPENANEHCPGTESESAGKADACAGCPNQQICATAPKGPDPDLLAINERLTTVKHKILVLSGKGGVGKSTFSAQLSFALAEMDYQVGLLDIDICGPSIPKMLGLEGQDIHQSNLGWSPVYVESNLGVMSIGFMLPNSDDAVIWRGPRKNGIIKQFLKDVDWGEIDYLVVDAPPGTSDEHISIVQYLQITGIDGAIIVTTPQQVSLIDVRKEINFCKKVGVPVLGVVENMSGLRQSLSDLKFVKPRDGTASKDGCNAPRFVEFVSPEGEIFVCATDVESGPLHQQDDLVDLGCSCKNELALAHYACALKWFISHGSTVCEICGNAASNVKPADFNKILASLKDYEALRERTSTGALSYLHYGADTGVDPDAVAAIRRQRLSEISSWFSPHNSHVAVPQGYIEQPPVSPSNNSVEHSVVAVRAVHTRWSLEGSGVFVAIGLGVVVLSWLVAPHVGKKGAVICLHMLLGGLCALTIIISLRFVFPRIQYGSMRCWAILFVFWFLVFGVWTSRTHSIRSS